MAIGLAADLRAIGPVLPFALGLLVVAVLAKLVGSAVAAALAGMSTRESGLVGHRHDRPRRGRPGGGDGRAPGRRDRRGVYAAVVLISVATTVITPLGIAAWSRVQSVRRRGTASTRERDRRRPGPIARLELE